MRDERTSLDVGAAPAAVSLGRVSRSDEQRDVQPVSDRGMATGLHALSRSQRLPTRSPYDPRLLICGTCLGQPNQFELDHDERCDECGGRGCVPDPDFIDGDADDFDPRSEFSTMPRLRGNGRGQL